MKGGKDSASPHYIFTKLSPVTRAIFHPDDDNVLRYLFEDNRRIEPEWYCPIIPMVLVNGASGIGTGWSTSIPNYNPRDLVASLRRMLDGEEPLDMVPWYKGFRGDIRPLDNSHFVCHGEISEVDGHTVEITELPVKVWTEPYKTGVLDTMVGGDKATPLITEYRDDTTDTTIKFRVRLTTEQSRDMNAAGHHKYFKIQAVIDTSSMVLFDADGVLRRYENTAEILRDFYAIRMSKYIDRKKFQKRMLRAQSDRLSNQARFIQEKISGMIKMENKKKAEIVEQLVKGKYDPDPVKAWKEKVKKKELQQGADINEAEGGDAESSADEGESKKTDEVETRLGDYDYLVSMSLIQLSEEEKDKLLRERDTKLAELSALKAKSCSDLWKADLDAFEEKLTEHEERVAKEAAEAGSKIKSKVAKNAAKTGGGRKGAAPKLADTMPTPSATRIQPKIDPSLKAKYKKIQAAKDKPPKRKGTSAEKPKDAKRKRNKSHSGFDSDEDSEIRFRPRFPQHRIS